MFNIAVCDDNQPEIDLVSTLLRKYQESHEGISIQLESFSSGEQLLEKVEAGVGYDLFLLDIFMPGLSGIELARKLRTKFQNAQLVFMTSSTDYMYDAFKLWAAQYLLKPVRKEEFFEVLDKMLATPKNKDDGFFIFQAVGRIVKIPLGDIICIELNNRVMNAHLVTKEVLTSRSIRVPFRTAVESLLGDSRFLHPHTSFVLNMEHVVELSGNSFILKDGKVVPVPRYKYAAAKEKYFDWLYQKRGQI